MPAFSPFQHQLWPDAVWDVSGAFVNDRELVSFFDFCKNTLGFEPFHIVHGAPLYEWNSGRVLKHLLRDTGEIRTAVQEYAKRRIALYLTFTNLLLDERHMSDPLGNGLCLYSAQNNPTGRNGVIVASDLLAAHIRREYPTLKLISSILKITNGGGKGKIDKYKQLADTYDEVMVHPDDVLNTDLLEKLEDKEPYILLVNEYCIRNCPLRPLHYTTLSQTALRFNAFDSTAFEKKQAGNGCRSLQTLLTDEKKGVLALNTPEIARLRAMGFRHFKLQGRGHANASAILFDLLRLVLREDSDEESTMHRAAQLFWETMKG